MIDGLTFLVPAHGAPRSLNGVLESIWRQRPQQMPWEIVLIDDGVCSSARDELEEWSNRPGVRLIPGDRRGAAAALNLGFEAAEHSWIAQIDQDVKLSEGWLEKILACTEIPDLGAAQGVWLTDRRSSIWARASGLDLEERYARSEKKEEDHVCTGHTLFSKEAVAQVGSFDESMGYGYDNDMSYRLRAAGYRLARCPAATSLHLWPETAGGYLRQQYGLGYGRLDLVAKHPSRVAGDGVSDWRMILHVPLSLLGLVALIAGLVSPLDSKTGFISLSLAVFCFAILAAERIWAGHRSWSKKRDPAAFLFVPIHGLRNLAWIAALARWVPRRLFRVAGDPRHSMLGKGGDTDTESSPDQRL